MERTPPALGLRAAATLLALLFAAIGPAAHAQDDETPDDEKPAEEAPAEPSPDDPEALKAKVAEQAERIAELELKVATMELEKVGAYIAVEGPEDGPKTTRLTLPKLWSGDPEALDALKALPELTVVYIDNESFDDQAAEKLKEFPSISSLTIMSPALTGAALEHFKALPGLSMLFLTDTEVGDDALAQLKELPALKELSLSRTAVTDAGLPALAELPELKTLYLIGLEVSDEAVAELQEAKPEARIVR